MRIISRLKVKGLYHFQNEIRSVRFMLKPEMRNLFATTNELQMGAPGYKICRSSLLFYWHTPQAMGALGVLGSPEA